VKTPSSYRWAPLATALAGVLAAGAAQAQDEQGRVISSTPVVQQVAVPRQVCTDEEISYQERKSGAGALLGALAGGAAGNAIGNGSGRAAATAIGLIGGAVLGNRIEGQPPTRTELVRSCGNQTFYENRTVAYDVVYEYAGRQYRTQMPQDPGRFVRLSVTPVDALPPPDAYPAPRPQVRYESGPVYEPGYGYAQPQVGGVILINGQRYHQAPHWRHPHDRYNRYERHDRSDRFERDHNR